jgi:hypothetical protein
MSKQKAKKEKKPSSDEPEYKGPNIYKELLTKQVPEIEMDLNAPDTILLNENVEFEILVDRIEAQCMRIQVDNKRLERIQTKVDTHMETAVSVKGSFLTRAVKERHEIST